MTMMVMIPMTVMIMMTDDDDMMMMIIMMIPMMVMIMMTDKCSILVHHRSSWLRNRLSYWRKKALVARSHTNCRTLSAFIIQLHLYSKGMLVHVFSEEI